MAEARRHVRDGQLTLAEGLLGRNGIRRRRGGRPPPRGRRSTSGPRTGPEPRAGCPRSPGLGRRHRRRARRQAPARVQPAGGGDVHEDQPGGVAGDPHLDRRGPDRPGPDSDRPADAADGPHGRRAGTRTASWASARWQPSGSHGVSRTRPSRFCGNWRRFCPRRPGFRTRSPPRARLARPSNSLRTGPLGLIMSLAPRLPERTDPPAPDQDLEVTRRIEVAGCAAAGGGAGQCGAIPAARGRHRQLPGGSQAPGDDRPSRQFECLRRLADGRAGHAGRDDRADRGGLLPPLARRRCW